FLNPANAFGPEKFLGIDGALGQRVPRSHMVSLSHLHTGTVGNLISFCFHVALDDHFPTVLHLADLADHTGNFSDRRLSLRIASLKQLLNPRQTLGDVVSSHTAGVEGTHRELGSRLSDGLGGDDAHGFANFHGSAQGQVAAVTLAADSVLRTAV